MQLFLDPQAEGIAAFNFFRSETEKPFTDLRNVVCSHKPKKEEEIKGVQRERLPLGEPSENTLLYL